MGEKTSVGNGGIYLDVHFVLLVGVHDCERGGLSATMAGFFFFAPETSEVFEQASGARRFFSR